MCPECNEGMGVRTLKCKNCGHVFMKGKNEMPKKPMKMTFNSYDEEEQDDEKAENFSRKNKATKKITLQLEEEEKITIDKMAKNCKPFNHSFDDGKLTVFGSVYIVDRGMDDCTHKRAPILPCHAVYAKIVVDPSDGTLSVWVLEDNGEPDRVYLNAVA